MRASDCNPGKQVIYFPSPGRGFRGVIDKEPWQLGSGVWVTKLTNMELAYSQFTGKRSLTVFAASLECIKERER